MIEACLLQSLGLNDCVCSWSVIEYILYFIRTLPHTHQTTQPADKTPAASISVLLHFFLLIVFPAFFLFVRSSSALCLTALIHHRCRFLSFHLMEAMGDKMMLSSNIVYVTGMVLWAVCCACSLPLA